jgi:hypothetical protein
MTNNIVIFNSIDELDSKFREVAYLYPQFHCVSRQGMAYDSDWTYYEVSIDKTAMVSDREFYSIVAQWMLERLGAMCGVHWVFTKDNNFYRKQITFYSKEHLAMLKLILEGNG